MSIGFGPFPGCPSDAGVQVVEALRADRWKPILGQLEIATAPATWHLGADIVRTAGAQADAIVLFACCPKADRILVPRMAVNRADPRASDAAGQTWAGGSIAPGSRPTRALGWQSSKVAALLRRAGLQADVCEDAGPYVFNRALWEIAGQPRARRVALVLLPVPSDARSALPGKADAARLSQSDMLMAAKIALDCLAVTAHLARSMPSGRGAPMLAKAA